MTLLDIGLSIMAVAAFHIGLFRGDIPLMLFGMWIMQLRQWCNESNEPRK